MVKRTLPRSIPFDLPGVTSSWLARANGCSLSTVRRRRASKPPNEGATAEFLAGLTAERALEMAQMRAPAAVLPLWSRMAIAELAARGATYAELMVIFGVGRSTVYRALHRTTKAYCALSGCRQLTAVQRRSLKPQA